jgi:hypothetical protein
MSDQPTALSSVTSIKLQEGSPPRPFLGGLEQRFVKAEDAMDITSNGQTGLDHMPEDMDEDKESPKS